MRPFTFMAAQSGGTAEVTEVTVSTGGNSANGENFRIYRSDGGGGEEEVAVVLNGGAKAQIFTVDFNGLTGLDFVTAGDGLYFDSYANVGTPKRFWFNTGTENAPADGGLTLVESIFSPVDGPNTIAVVLAASMGGVASVSSAVVTVTASSTGTLTDPSAGTSPAVIVVTQVGRDATGPVGGVTSLIADISGAESDDDNIAAAIQSACDTHGWTVTRVASVDTFTDSAVGVRTPPTNCASCTLNVITPGTNP